MARRIARLALDAALVTAVVIAVFIAYGLIGNRWYRVVAVASGSMEPALPVGSLIVITPPSEPLAVGEIITFVGDGRLVTHRIVEVRPDGFPVTQGDANNTPDAFVNVTVVGRVTFSIPWLGFVIPGASSGAAFRVNRSASATIDVGTWVEPAVVATAAPVPEPAVQPSGPPLVEPASPEPSVEPAPSAPPTDPPAPTPEPTPSPDAEQPSAEQPSAEQPSAELEPTPKLTPSPAAEPAPEPTPDSTPEPTGPQTPKPELAPPPPKG